MRRSFRDLPSPAFGTFSQVASADLIDMLGAQGFDFAIVDCEHGAFGLETAENLLRACDANGLVPIIRAPLLDARWIGRALDSGAAAVVVPGIETAAQAAAAVAAARFAPHGTRGACPCIRAGGHVVRDWPTYATAESAKGIIALVETEAGLAEIEAIAATPGLLALLPGPFDLAVSMGLQGDWRHPRVEAAMDRMAAAARGNGVALMASIFDPDPGAMAARRARWAARGATLFALGTDKILFSAAAGLYRGAMG
jgi:4-hydroxy-2-oxoheptanedioate aldolase